MCNLFTKLKTYYLFLSLHFKLRRADRISREWGRAQFLRTAKGERLDYLGLLFECERLPNEDDANYRVRVYKVQRQIQKEMSFRGL